MIKRLDHEVLRNTADKEDMQLGTINNECLDLAIRNTIDCNPLTQI
jgi:hypothetical protein